MSRLLLSVTVLCAVGCQHAAKPTGFEKIGEFSSTRGKFIFAWIDPAKSTDMETIVAAAKALEQPPGAPCTIIFWSDRSKIASTFPLTEDQDAAKVGAYGLHINGTRSWFPKDGDPVTLKW